MKYLITIAILKFLLSPSYLGIAQTMDSTEKSAAVIQTDTTNTSKTDLSEGTDDFSPGLAFFTLLGIGFVLVCVGVGIVLTVVGLFIIFGLISFGILSASVLIGLNKKSFAIGFKTFTVSASTIGGLILCGFGFWILNHFLNLWKAQAAIAIGTTLGLLSGLIFGFLTFYVLQQLTTFLKKKLDKKIKNDVAAGS